MRRISVHCGASLGASPAYAQYARKLGRLIADSNLVLVYGGSAAGTMGILADTVLEFGGEVIGVISKELVRMGASHPMLTDLRIVENLRDRKSLMAELCDIAVTLPGGLGTLDETLEFLTLSQLQMHTKPCGFLNIEGFFDHLRLFLDHVVSEGFVKPAHRDLFIFETEPERLIERLKVYVAPREPKWIDGRPD